MVVSGNQFYFDPEHSFQRRARSPGDQPRQTEDQLRAVVAPWPKPVARDVVQPAQPVWRTWRRPAPARKKEGKVGGLACEPSRRNADVVFYGAAIGHVVEKTALTEPQAQIHIFISVVVGFIEAAGVKKSLATDRATRRRHRRIARISATGVPRLRRAIVKRPAQQIHFDAPVVEPASDDGVLEVADDAGIGAMVAGRRRC
jgi:hypothetical protein